MGLLKALSNLLWNNANIEDVELFGSEYTEKINVQETTLHSIHSMPKRAIVTRTPFNGYPSHSLSGYSATTRPGPMRMLDEWQGND